MRPAGLTSLPEEYWDSPGDVAAGTLGDLRLGTTPAHFETGVGVGFSGSCEGCGHRMVGCSLQEVPYIVGCVLTASNPCTRNCREPAACTQAVSSLHQSQSMPGGRAGNSRCHLHCWQLSWGRVGCRQTSEDSIAEPSHHAGVRTLSQRLVTAPGAASDFLARSQVPNFLQKRL